MSLCLNESLQKLEKLSARELLATSQRVRKELGSAEWKMAVCLLATERCRSYRKLGYANISEYAEKALHLSGKKTGELLGTARALEHLPRVSAAFQTGRLCWGKLRALKGLLTPETEQQWLEFALGSTTAEVVSKVSASPREWKRYQALQASLEGRPVNDNAQVQKVLSHSAPGEDRQAASSELTTDVENPPVELKQPAERSPSPDDDQAKMKVAEETKPQTIRVVIEMTPDQYALYERAESRARAKAGRRLSRGAAVTQMAKALLDQGSARERSRHQVVIHTDNEGLAWYETERGLLPVAPEVLEGACKHRDKIVHFEELKPTSSEPPSSLSDDTKKLVAAAERETRAAAAKRTAIPNGVLRLLFARAKHRCERCKSHGGQLHVHHLDPVSDGGEHRLDRLLLLCSPCHSMVHETDYDQRPEWRAARDRALRSKSPAPTLPQGSPPLQTETKPR